MSETRNEPRTSGFVAPSAALDAMFHARALLERAAGNVRQYEPSMPGEPLSGFWSDAVGGLAQMVDSLAGLLSEEQERASVSPVGRTT